MVCSQWRRVPACSVSNDERGQALPIAAIAMTVFVPLLLLLVVDLAAILYEIRTVQAGVRLAVESAVVEVLAGGADDNAPHTIRANRARQAAYEVAVAVLEANGYDPTLLDGADVPGCESGSGPCIYVQSASGCGLDDPLAITPITRCGPFVSMRVRLTVRAIWSGVTVTRHFYAAAESSATPRGLPAIPIPTNTNQISVPIPFP